MIPYKKYVLIYRTDVDRIPSLTFSRCYTNRLKQMQNLLTIFLWTAIMYPVHGLSESTGT